MTNFVSLRQRASYLAMQSGWDGVNPQPDWFALVNQALGDFSWDTEYNQEELTITSVANQASYLLPTPYFKTIKDVAYNTLLLAKSSEADERKIDPLWVIRPAGTPARYLIPGPNVLRIIDIPSTSGDTIDVRGTRFAPALVNDTDAPGFPDTWHEAVALRAAVLHCEPFVSGDGVTKLELFREQYAGMVKACKTYLAEDRYGSLQRTVSSPLRRRSYLRLSGRY